MRLSLPLSAALMVAIAASGAIGAAPQWTSPDRHRILLTVDSRGVNRSNSPATVNLNFPQALRNTGAKGSFDESTVEVVGYDMSGKPRIFDASRKGYEKYLLPFYIEKYYGVDYVTVHFVVPNAATTKYGVYFDTKESKPGKPQRYTGLVGDGDYFRIGYTRREIGASHMDSFCDIDGDGDLDLFEITTEPFIYCYENVGGNRFVERGKMTSGGSLFMLPHSPAHRSWAVITFHDWDGDGDQDLFSGFGDGPDGKEIAYFENVTAKGGQITFAKRSPPRTQTGKSMGGGWFPAVTIVDWDNDGKKDVIIGRDRQIEMFRNVSADKKDMRFADSEHIKADGKDIELRAARAECADIDADGDLDLISSTQGEAVFLYENIGTRSSPVFKAGVSLPNRVGGHGGIKVADFDGDGLLDYVTGSVWERKAEPEDRRFYARLYKNVGSKTKPEFEERDAYHGAPYTEQFQMCEAGRQNTVRAVDWDNDGAKDLIAGTESQIIYYFRNTGNNLYPSFVDGERLLEPGGGAPRTCVCDWNNDGKKDLLVTHFDGKVEIYLNQGTDAAPVLGPAKQIYANGKPIDGTTWCSALVCDWDNDGRKDIIFGMAGGLNPSGEHDWPHWTGNIETERGFLFYRNVGTDAEPELAYPSWVQTGVAGNSRPIQYTRPNVGSYVDWDGDGKKDFIACEFENAIHLYRNTGPGSANAAPEFSWPVDGKPLLIAWTLQTISGVDALDFNGDGDIDILTGQGHGGSGLRFYERDYIEDLANDTFPVVTVERFERK
ncbi:MAG: VCBS repeat-containing protein [Armatimonadota bacterium]|nr:VCBS repeat-containing protein [Armatimonadota bacterium]